jgi:hypothetical protein
VFAGKRQFHRNFFASYSPDSKAESWNLGIDVGDDIFLGGRSTLIKVINVA